MARSDVEVQVLSDIDKLIEISNEKLANNSNFASRVYRDEPIIFTASQMAAYTPPQYREMRKMTNSGELYYASAAKIFYHQGKFMEDFEDDFDYQGEFKRYFPTYGDMSDTQLRGYFSWRTKVRHGDVGRTSLSFAFVYVYELLNQIGTGSPEEGYYKLKNFWTAYRYIDPRIDRYVELWLKDYVIYNNLDRSLLEDFADINFDNKVLTLLDDQSHSADEVFAALNSLSSYNMEHSRFFKIYGEDVKNIVSGVFRILTDYYDKNRKNSICEKFFGKFYAEPYSLFKSAVFYNRAGIQQDFVYEINDIYKYSCQSGKWSRERFFCYKGKNQQIGLLLKTVDFLMRQKYNFKSTLKEGVTTKIFLDIINKEIEKYLEYKKEKERPKIEIDVSKLQNIRDTAMETRNKLIVEEYQETEPPELTVENDTCTNTAGLGENEYLLLQCLLYGKAYDGLLKAKGLMLSVLVDAVNESLFELFNDTVLVYDGDRPELIEDYTDELKGIIKE